MRYAKRLLSKLAIALFCLTLSSCAPFIRTPTVKETAASFDGNVQDSGFIGFDAAGNGIITPHARDRYNTLAAMYGCQFHPRLRPGDGLTATTTNTFLIDAQHLVAFAKMNRWLKSGGAPK